MVVFLKLMRDFSNRMSPTQKEKGVVMLYWTVTLLVIALVAAVLGFGGIAGTAAGLAKILFAVFLVLFIVSLLFGRRRVP